MVVLKEKVSQEKTAPVNSGIESKLCEVDRLWVEETVMRVADKMLWLSEKSAEKIPSITIDGVHDDKRCGDYEHADNGLQWWTNGFWGGMLWQMYHATGERNYAAIARKSEVWLDACFDTFHGLHHDVGFMWLPTAIADFRLTGNKDARRRGLHAANLLAGRFNPVGRFIRAWNDHPCGLDTRGWAIIDCMLNLPLLYWASEETGDPRFRHIAMIHADTVMDTFIREDGSSEHIVEFDPENGGKVRAYGGQGYADGSAWTRGQSWALYGFVASYLHTGKAEYLDIVKRVARYVIDQIPQSGLIPIDFDQPLEPALEDSTAAAVLACGLIELAKATEGVESSEYVAVGLKLLKTLDCHRCDYGPENDHFLINCSGAYQNNHHMSLVYADYFYLEALLKLKGKDLFLW